MNGTPLRAPELSNASDRADSRSCCTLTSIWTSAKILSPTVARCIPVLGNAIVGSHLVAPRPNPDSWAPDSVVQRLDLGTRQIPHGVCDVYAERSSAPALSPPATLVIGR